MTCAFGAKKEELEGELELAYDIIADKDDEINRLEHDIGERDDEIDALKAQLAARPPTTPHK